MDRLKYISADDEIRAIADLRQEQSMGKNSELTVARDEGKAEGLAEGELKKARETALNLLAMNLSIEQIAKATGLTSEEIQNLSSKK